VVVRMVLKEGWNGIVVEVAWWDITGGGREVLPWKNTTYYKEGWWLKEGKLWMRNGDRKGGKKCPRSRGSNSGSRKG